MRSDLPLPLRGALQGTIRRDVGAESARVDIAATVQGMSRPARLDVRIAGRPLFGGGLQMTSSVVSLGTTEQPTLYAGRIVMLRGARILARLHRPGSRSLSLALALRLPTDSSQVTGTATAREVA
jgi:hypothetical protein